MAFLFTRIFRYVIFVAVMFSLIQLALRHIEYTFSPRVFRTTAEKFVGKSPTTSIRSIMAELRTKYGGHVLPDSELQWFPISVDGMQLRFMLIHGSLTEYMGIWGTHYGTTGHIGTHWVNQTCTVLTGSVDKMDESVSNDKMETFAEGGNLRLTAFYPVQVRLAPETWVLCYGRGFMPLSGAHIKIGTLIQSGDMMTFARLMYSYGASSFRELALFAHHMVDHVKKTYLGM